MFVGNIYYYFCYIPDGYIFRRECNPSGIRRKIVGNLRAYFWRVFPCLSRRISRWITLLDEKSIGNPMERCPELKIIQKNVFSLLSPEIPMGIHRKFSSDIIPPVFNFFLVVMSHRLIVWRGFREIKERKNFVFFVDEKT